MTWFVNRSGTRDEVLAYLCGEAGEAVPEDVRDALKDLVLAFAADSSFNLSANGALGEGGHGRLQVVLYALGR